MLAIHLRNLPPPDETFDHVEFLALMARWIKPEHYLELGVRDGRNFLKVAPLCKLATGVDTSFMPFAPEPNMELVQNTTDSYFKSLKGTDTKFDMVFIDADHSHEQSLRDFLNAFPRVIDDGFIFFHDTYPCLPYLFDKQKSDNCYKTALYIKQNMRDKCEIITLPFNPGVTVVKKIAGNRQFAYET
jgi:predicted O-methyltransferase YrrM